MAEKAKALGVGGRFTVGQGAPIAAIPWGAEARSTRAIRVIRVYRGALRARGYHAEPEVFT